MNIEKFYKNIREHINQELDPFLQLLFEGGAFGHLAHPYEDADLTFGDVKDIIKSALSGKLEAYEKVDGQNLMITWKNGALRAARNKGHLKNAGENSLTKDQLDAMFADKPENVRRAFVTAMEDLAVSLSKIPQETLNSIFQNGKRFMNIEVMLPETQNVVPYGLNILMFHGIIEYDEAGNPTANVDQGAETLYKVIKDVNADIQNTFTIKGPQKVLLNKLKDVDKKQSEFLLMLKPVQGNLSDRDKVIKYHIKEWHKLITDRAKELGYEIPSDVLTLLVDRWALSKKSPNITQVLKKIDNKQFAEWAKDFDKRESMRTAKKINQPLERLFLQLGVEVLSNASGFLAAQPTDSAKQISNYVSTEVEKIRKSGDPAVIQKLEHELQRIQSLGGLEKVVGSEGVVFYRNGKIYKLTGLFAPINQILGMIKYQRK